MGLADLLEDEVRALGALETRQQSDGVFFQGDLEVGYRTCLWARIPSRVLLHLGSGTVDCADAFYSLVYGLPWEDHIDPRLTIAVDVIGTNRVLRHSGFSAQKAKDAIVDRLREKLGQRPDVDSRSADLRIHVRIRRDKAQVFLDLSGRGLHRRGYRCQSGSAPLRENLAAGVLLRCGWPELAAREAPLVDPFCGSGTLLIEAAWMALDRAPGLLRATAGCTAWLGHDEATWQELLQEAFDRAEKSAGWAGRLYGSDISADAIVSAGENAATAGVADSIVLTPSELGKLRAPTGPTGLFVTNAPYGVRVGSKWELNGLYDQLSHKLTAEFSGWQAGVLTDDAHASLIQLRARRINKLKNGDIDCRLLRFDISEKWQPSGPKPTRARSPGATMFGNRVAKNLRHLRKWANKNGVSCYRLYDADMPEYALAVDLYEADRLYAHVQEYRAPDALPEKVAVQRLDEAVKELRDQLCLSRAQIAVKQRRRQRGNQQYERLDRRDHFVTIRENEHLFRVNLWDYLDTGLFLDHRKTRALVQDRAQGGDFLNLFAYTGSATVYAAMGGATSTTSVDLSATYLDWARRNLELNDIVDNRHQLIKADVIPWIKIQAARKVRFDLIFLDPPTFSNSKSMQHSFDVQRDHAELIRDASRLLKRDGRLIFSSNRRKFALNTDALEHLAITNISTKTIPEDFSRKRNIHHCYEICLV